MIRGALACLCLLACSPHATTTPATRAEPARYDGPIIDIHAHVRTSQGDAMTSDQPVGVSELAALERASGVEHAALIVIARAGRIDDTRAANDAVLELARASEGQFFAVPSVHPADGDAARVELERLAGLGARMIKLHPNTQGFDVAAPEVAAVVERAAALRLVVLFDGYSPFDADQTGKFLRLAITHPDARIVLAHLGAMRFDEMAVFGLARRFEWYPRNVWFDLSAIASFYGDSPYAGQLRWVVRAIGVDRVMFGSDWPVDPPARALAGVRALGFTADEQRQILHDTAAALLGL
jgi:predicted TIM-barrel fold metal-dependent hydrolase